MTKQQTTTLIKQIYLKQNVLKKFILLPLLSLLTCFLILPILKMFVKLKVFLIYEECHIQKATHVLMLQDNKAFEVVDVYVIQDQKYFYYKKVKYQLCSDNFNPLIYDIQDSLIFKDINFLSNGLSTSQSKVNLDKFGYCQHIVDIPSFVPYVFHELTTPIALTQYIIFVIYVFESYYTFVIIMLCIFISVVFINYYILRNSLIKLKQFAEKDIKVEVLRDSTYKQIDSRQLVPGDIFIPNNQLICDSILIRGQVYVNEAGLSGQNIPIAKFTAKNLSDIKQTSKLYEGSYILQSRLKPLALVLRTGFLTKKGLILRNILFKEISEPEIFKYQYYLIAEIFVIGFISYIVILKSMIDMHISTHLILFRFFDLVGYILPLENMIILNLTYSTSMYRLRRRDIYCTQPCKTIESAKIKIMCFDKTGTLTNNKMKIHSIIDFKQNTHKQILITDSQRNRNDLSMKLFATCHTARKIENRLYGDQLDMCIYEYSGYEYVESSSQSIVSIFKNDEVELEVLKVNQFESKFQSMSAIVKDKLLDECYVFVKGALEKLYDRSVNKPLGLHDLVKDLSFKGLRALAYGYKRIKINDIGSQLDLEREDLEQDITLLGIVTFDNSLKEDCIQTIRSMKEADIETKMITGDNIYIAIETAMRSQIISSQEKVMIFEGNAQKYHDRFIGQVIFIQDGVIITNDVELSPQEFCTQTMAIAIDNAFFLRNPPLPPNVKIFARISPQSKASIVRRLKQYMHSQWADKGLWNRLMGKSKAKVGMIGDQTNDILAIKQADIGIGINQAQSSMVAYFSVNQLLDLQYLIIQGKSTLMIAIQALRYSILYNFCVFYGFLIQSIDYSAYADFQYSLILYPQLYGLIIALFFSNSSKKISKTYPNQNLISLQYNIPCIFHTAQFILCNTILLIILYTKEQYIPARQDQHDWTFSSQTNTAVYLCAQFLYLFNIIFIYKSDPWKQQFYKNYLLLIWVIILATFSIFLSVGIPFNETSHKILSLVKLPDELRYKIFWITCLFGLAGVIQEHMIRKMKQHQLI